MRLVHLGGKGYIVLGVVSANTSYSGDELKSQWRLADTILQKNNDKRSLRYNILNIFYHL